ncbi:Small COPII coat GTPase SAR1 [Tritrichomonas foetus]|uniref:Small COPII coat GTPase SAR1 n=1 Tax=Tritrichomonas foetus TaxID=1144522 RepID=A0A1J4J5C5_9EUKA|nr:Small COPII coat GTPase SAR1 [Tritrichomonas foetus]|eukprot:OHS93343.1 Small COPII coat GTPase SAR1 [Tritrichomonas foetus]
MSTTLSKNSMYICSFYRIGHIYFENRSEKMWLLDWIFSFFSRFFPSQLKKSKVYVVGLDNAGKTTIIHSMKTGKFEKCEKTEKYNTEKLQMAGIEITAVDFGGGYYLDSRSKSSWKEVELFASCNGIVFVIDASHPERFEESKKILVQILDDGNLSNVPILIMANKVDVAGAASYSDISSFFQLKQLYGNDQTVIQKNARPIHLVMTSVPQKFGFVQGFKWLSHFL